MKKIKLMTQKTGNEYEFLVDGVVNRTWSELSDDCSLTNMTKYIQDYVLDLKFDGKLFECDFKVSVPLY